MRRTLPSPRLALVVIIWLVAAAAHAADRAVYVAGRLTPEDLLTLTAAAGSEDPPPVVLLDTPAAAPYLKPFLAAYKPDRVVPVGKFDDNLEPRLGVKPAAGLETLGQVWGAFFPGGAAQAVVCPAQPRGQLLQAACLAGAARSPLVVLRGADGEADELRQWLGKWKAREVVAVGEAANVCRGLEKIRVTHLADAAAVATAHVRRITGPGPVETLVVANPADMAKGVGMSCLAPYVALHKRAPLLLTSAAGDDTATVVRRALEQPALQRADALMIVAAPKAVLTEKRPNPAAGKDTEIEMEPLTPQGAEPFTFATGRLFHADLGVPLLTLARQRLLADAAGPRTAVLASNPGGGLPLLEMFSRHTAQELRNRGYQTAAKFEDEVDKDDLRRRLPEADIFLWEGHYKTLVEEFGMPKWTEPLRPGLVFLQSCLALNEAEAPLLLQRGAVAVVGTPTRNYSGTGGAYSLAFFDALLYDGRTLGGSLRQAKNFLICYAMLKQRRLGEGVKLSGANLRSAWAFTLWGDPTLSLPTPPPPANALPPVRHRVSGDQIILTRPAETYAKSAKEKYLVKTWPNARLAGLVAKGEDDETRRLVPFLFAEVKLTPPATGGVPRLTGKLAERSWAWLWDARRSVGYLLVVPPTMNSGDVRFQVAWGE